MAYDPTAGLEEFFTEEGVTTPPPPRPVLTVTPPAPAPVPAPVPAAAEPTYPALTVVPPAPASTRPRPGVLTRGRYQLACFLSPRTAAALAKARTEYGTNGNVLVHALAATGEECVEYFTRERTPTPVPGTGFVLTGGRTRKVAPTRVTFKLEPRNADALGELMGRCGVGDAYSELCEQALVRFLNITS